MIGAEESDETVEEQDWGCKKEIPIATNATEFADRLSRETIRDAYSVFGLRSDCSDDDIKRNYKRLAALVSPDKVKFFFFSNSENINFGFSVHN